MVKIDLLQHSLVPPHRVLPEAEKVALLTKLNVSEFQLPSIRRKDPIIENVKTKVGDIIQITRVSKTDSEYPYYRRVI